MGRQSRWAAEKRPAARHFHIDPSALPRNGRVQAALVRAAMDISTATELRYRKTGILPQYVLRGWFDACELHEAIANQAELFRAAKNRQRAAREKKRAASHTAQTERGAA